MAQAQQNNSQLINIRVKDAVDEANAWALVRVLVWEFHVDLPVTASEGGCTGQHEAVRVKKSSRHTFFRSLEADVEFLPAEEQHENQAQPYLTPRSTYTANQSAIEIPPLPN